MTLNQLKKDLQEVKGYLIKKQKSNEENYSVIYSIASKCPKLAEILKQREEYAQQIGFFNIPLDKRAVAFTRDIQFGKFEIEILNAVMEYQKVEEAMDDIYDH